eukprot:SAG22_NODE_3427_length_1718_cov_3.228536_1_plen_289_part_10
MNAGSDPALPAAASHSRLCGRLGVLAAALHHRGNDVDTVRRPAAPASARSMPRNMPDVSAFELSAEQRYEFDVKGYFVLKAHYSPAQVARFHAGVDELQAIPLQHSAYTELGIASHHLAAAMEDPSHAVWQDAAAAVAGTVPADFELEKKFGWPKEARDLSRPPRVDHMICGTDKFDEIIRDPVLKALHRTLAGGNIYMSSTYFIEKLGPAEGGFLHNNGFPKDRHFHYEYDHTHNRFLCSSTRSVVMLSDMSTIDAGPFAAIPGSHKASFECPYDTSDACNNPMAVPV